MINKTTDTSRANGIKGCVAGALVTATLVLASNTGASALPWATYDHPLYTNPYVNLSSEYYYNHYYYTLEQYYQQPFTDSFNALYGGNQGASYFEASYPTFFNQVLDGVNTAYNQLYNYYWQYDYTYDVTYYSYAWNYLF